MNKVVSEMTSTSLNETKKITDKLVIILKNRVYRILDTELKVFWMLITLLTSRVRIDEY